MAAEEEHREPELSWAGLTLETWDVGWTCMDQGSLNLTAARLMTLWISKGQDEGCWDTMQGNTVSISWFTLSVWLLDWGWNQNDKLTVVPTNVQNSFQKREVN